MFCRHCGSEIPDGSKFCENCGILITRIDPVEVSVQDEDAASSDKGKPNIPVLPVNVAPTPVYVPKDPKRVTLTTCGAMTACIALSFIFILDELKVSFHPVMLLLMLFSSFGIFTIIFSSCKKVSGGLFVFFLITLIVISCCSPFSLVVLNSL